MNIFALDEQPKLAAQAHVDAHVSKMIIEYAQLMSTAHHLTDSPHAEHCYKVTHKNHPSAKWARASIDNYLWLHELWCELHSEFSFRRGKAHKTYVMLADTLCNPPELPHKGLMPVFLALPFRLKYVNCESFSDAVACYRSYYAIEKEPLHKWTKRSPPTWIKAYG